MPKYILLSLMILSGCAIFHGDLNSKSGDLPKKQVTYKISVFKEYDGQKEQILLSESEKILLRAKIPGLIISEDKYEHELTITHKNLSKNVNWKTISLFTLTLVPYWEKSEHIANIKSKDGKSTGEYKLESAFVMNFFLFPVQIYNALTDKNGLADIRAELVEAAFREN